MPIKQKLTVFAVALSALLGAADISQMVGSEPTALQLITLFASGFGAGASVVALLRPKPPALRADVTEQGTQSASVPTEL